MSYKKITIEYDSGRTRTIEEPIAIKVWTWEDVEGVLRTYVLDKDTSEEEVKQKMEEVKKYWDYDWSYMDTLEACDDSEWSVIEDAIRDSLED